MNSGASEMPMLQERLVAFNHGYRMNCECGDITPISVQEYHEKEAQDALIPCDHCERTIHFGPAVAALRDPNDPALDDSRLNEFAWYHTSTDADWPSGSYVAKNRILLRKMARKHDLPEAHFESHLNKALHVGTYEAAIENMLRRMGDDGLGDAEFYLHRIALSTGAINENYRDENHEPAAQLTVTELEEDGLTAVRYLNVNEDVGSLSLALLPTTITWVQTVPLPITELTPPHSPSLLSLFHKIQSKLDALAESRPDTSGVEPHHLREMELGLRPDPDAIAARAEQHEQECRELHTTLEEALLGHALGGVSPVVAEEFRIACNASENSDPTKVREYAERIATTAALLTRPMAVVEILAAQEPRAVRWDASASPSDRDDGDSE